MMVWGLKKSPERAINRVKGLNFGMLYVNI